MLQPPEDAASTPPAGQPAPAPARMWLYWLLLALIVGVSLAGNLYWTRQNVLFVGHDSTSYMVAALDYRDFLYPLTPQSIFRAFVEPNYRPPAIYIAAQPFFALFGWNLDGGQMLNVALHAAVILLTVWLGWQVTGRWTALFAGALVAFLPMLAAMARLFYTEMLLVAAVVFNLLALYKSRGFSRRGWSVAWGASLGVGMLVKWTIPMVVAAPALWVLWEARGSLFRFSWRPRLRSAALAAIPALIFAAVWYLPNRSQAAPYPLGDWLFLGWFLLAWGAAWALMVRPSAAANLTAGVFVGLLVASLWYLPHSNIGQLLLEVDQERASQSASLFNWRNYRRYGRYFYFNHLGPLAFWIVIPATLLPWLWSGLARRRWLNRKAILLILSVVTTVLALTMIAQGNHRNLTPLLPQIALLVAIAFAWYPRWLRWMLGGATLLVLVTQWTLVTTDRFTPVYEQWANLWVPPEYAMPPASGLTDPAYWIAPELIEAVTAAPMDRQTLAMLINTSWLHRGHLRYLTRVTGRNLNLVDLTEEGATWQELISSAWVAYKTGDDSGLDAEAAHSTHDRVEAGDPLFDALYQQVASWKVPDGEEVRLYHRAGPGRCCQQQEPLAPWETLAGVIRDGWSEHATLIYSTDELAVLVGRFDPAPGPLLVLAEGADDPYAPLRGQTGTLFVVLDPGEANIATWLDANGYKAVDVGNDGAWVAVYGVPDAPLVETGKRQRWGDTRLDSLQTQTVVAPGDVLPLRASFSGPSRAPEAALKWSVRLLAPDGTVLASQDRSMSPGDHFGLFVPPDTPAGNYPVVALAYDPATLAPVVDSTGAEMTHLFDVTVAAE